MINCASVNIGKFGSPVSELGCKQVIVCLSCFLYCTVYWLENLELTRFYLNVPKSAALD